MQIINRLADFLFHLGRLKLNWHGYPANYGYDEIYAKEWNESREFVDSYVLQYLRIS